MIRLLADENFNRAAVSGLQTRRPDLDLVRVQDVGLEETADPLVLRWAADHDRIVLTHDKRTMPGFARARVAAGEPMPGLFVFHDDKEPVGRIIDELILLDECSEHSEWAGQLVFLPM
jgi:hypothetical protein